jgi:hypothetical protein
MIKETIRQASIIIAIISQSQYYKDTWKELPSFIAGGSNVQAGAVVITMRDYGGFNTEELKRRIKRIRPYFWPSVAEDASQLGVFFACSSTVGTQMQRLREMIIENPEMPTWEALYDSGVNEVGFLASYHDLTQSAKKGSVAIAISYFKPVGIRE